MHSKLAFLRAEILRAMGLSLVLGGCCTERTTTSTACIELDPGELACPDVEYLQEELGLENVVGLSVYPERRYELDGRSYVAPTECCYDHEETVSDCGGSHGFGRPFVVEGKAMVAPLVSGSGWLGRSQRIGLSRRLSEEERAREADGWRERGRLEHAAVASFARFALELLGLGAPLNLVRAAQRASLEEMVHAETCFGIAFAYDGRRIGPGALPVAGALAGTPVAADVARRVVREGCVEEALGAAELLERATREPDPLVRKTLRRLARDEARHAALGYKSLGWLVAIDDGVRVAAREALSDARDAMVSMPAASLTAWSEVVAPLARAVMS
jgi:hypothetical protein